MKISVSFFIFLGCLSLARAATTSGSSYTTRAVTVTAGATSFDFSIGWSCDDYPQSSAPGRLELLDGAGNLVARLVAGVYRTGGPSFSVTGTGNVTNTSSWMVQYAVDGSAADGGVQGTWNLSGLVPGSYSMRMWRYTTYSSLHASTVWTDSSLDSYYPTPGNNSAPTIAWIYAPSSPGNGQAYTVGAHAHDADGNLAQVTIWKNGQPFTSSGGGNGTDGDASGSSADAGPQTITYTAQAVDAAGATSAVITQSASVAAPPPTQYSLTVHAGAGGTVPPGGTYDSGAMVGLFATPDTTHDFLGWSGDAGGTANPVSVIMDRDKSVTATFSPKLFALNTSATAGGEVTPGGSYPFGTSLTISATPDATHRFIGWAGDAAGAAPSVLVTLTRPLSVQAVFIDKIAQTVAFLPPGNQPAGGVFALVGNASSGLPVSFVLVSGPAVISGNQLELTGPGAVTVQANQPGDGIFLPAPSVTQTFNAVATALLKYRPDGRTVLTTTAATGAAPFVLEKP